jgi:hypothetical protein
MIKQFFDFYDYYVEVCTENSNKDGQQMMVKDRELFSNNKMLFFVRIHLAIVGANLNMDQYYNV